MESICGKNCGDCAWRESQGCPGCQDGPGRQFGGTCEVAACCRGKGHETCGTCTLLPGCTLRMWLEDRPLRRQRRLEEIQAEERRLDAMAPLLGRWLWLLFWLLIPSSLAQLMSLEQVVQAVPVLRGPGEVLQVLVNLASGLMLLRLAPAWGRYRTAGWCTVAVAAFDAVTLVLGLTEEAWLWWVLALPAMAAGTVGIYQEYTAHAEVLEGEDNTLARRWRLLWKWYIGLALGMFGCIFLLFISEMLGVLLLLGAVIGMIVTAVLRMVFLYQTAVCFRNRAARREEAAE